MRNVLEKSPLSYVGTAIGLFIPLPLTAKFFMPIISPDMADAVVALDSLSKAGIHTASGANPLYGKLFPLTPAFFMTYMNGIIADPISKFIKAVIISYVLFAVAFLFFAICLRAKKFWINILLAIPGGALGFVLLRTALCGSNLIGISIFLFLALGLLLLGIRLSLEKVPKKARYGIKAAISVLCVVPMIPVFMYRGAIGFVFSQEGEDIRITYGELTDYLTSNNISEFYSTSDISNIMKILSRDSISVDYCRCSELPIEEFRKGMFFYIDSSKEAPADPALSTVFSFSDKIYEDATGSIYSYNSYDAYFFSMFDVTELSVEDFEIYTALNMGILDNCIDTTQETESLDLYNSYIFPKGNAPEKVYLGIDPMMIRSIYGDGEAFETFVKEKIGAEIRKHNMTEFTVVFPYYEIEHYAGYSQNDIEAVVSCYERTVECLKGAGNLYFQFPGTTEWIYSNPDIFVEGSDVVLKEGPANKVFAQLIAKMFPSDPEYVSEYAKDLSELISTYSPKKYEPADLSDTCIVIFGDSIFGNFNDETSIQSIIADNCGASVICKAIGGASAARCDVLQCDDIFANQMKDLDALGAEISTARVGKDRLVFILEFGLNDYIIGLPVDDPEDPHNTDTFAGAMRTAIERINGNWPESEILILSPGYVNIYESGTVATKEVSGDLEAYRKSSAEIAEEYNADIMDLTKDLGITQETFVDHSYLDGVHYDERGRIVLARKLADFICVMPR